MMTLQEYLNQPDPQRLPAGSVLVNPTELSHSWHKGQNYKDPYTGKTIPLYEVELKFGNSYYTYHLHPKSLVLWTMDSDGNPRNESVFKLTEWP